jgi:Flp pilus assembly protein TadD
MRTNKLNQTRVFYLMFGLLLVLPLAGCDPNAKGNTLLKEGKYSEAATYFEGRVKSKPSDPVLNNQLGFSYAKMGKMAEAEKSYKAAVAAKADYPEAHYNLGYLYMNRPFLMYDDAIKEFDKAIQLRADYAKAYNNRGLTESYLGKFESARKDLEKAISLDSSNQTYKDNLEWSKRMETVTKAVAPNKDEGAQPQENKKEDTGAKPGSDKKPQ